MSVEALASAWARTENAADGSIVVADTEISGRLRGGTPWRSEDGGALLMAMVIRPTIDPLKEALLWLVASLGAADALETVTGTEHTVHWPDTIIRTDSTRRDGNRSDSIRSDSEGARCVVNVMTQLGPGRVEHAVLAVRAHLDGLDVPAGDSKEQLILALQQQLQAATRLIESDSLALLEAFNDRCAAISRRARVSLLPRGEARGRVTAVDSDGFLVLESPTGMLERIAPATLRSLELLD